MFLFGFVVGAGLILALLLYRNKNYRQEKKNIEQKYQDSIKAIEADRVSKIVALESARKELDLLKDAIGNLTIEEVKARLSSSTLSKIESITSSSVDSAVSSIMDRVRDSCVDKEGSL